MMKAQNRVAVAAVAVALGAVALLAVDPAWAQSVGGGSLKPVEGVFDFLVKFLQGPLARSAAIIAVCALGYMAIAGRITWMLCLAVVSGISLIFGASTLVDALKSAIGT